MSFGGRDRKIHVKTLPLTSSYILILTFYFTGSHFTDYRIFLKAVNIRYIYALFVQNLKTGNFSFQTLF